MFDALEPTLLALGSFFLVALAAKWIGSFFSQYGLPYITGYLLAGMLAGPFILDLMDGADAENLRFIDELSLAVIAFIAGSELYLKELRTRLRPIALNTLGVVLIAPILIGISLFIATNYIGFTSDFNTEQRLAVAILGGTILMALSPASTVAVIKEVKARGQFTKTVLSMTVVMDVVIIVLFAISVAFADVLVSSASFEATFVLSLLIDLLLAIGLGIAVGLMLSQLMAANINGIVKMGLVLLLGWGIFAVIHQIDIITKDAGFELHLEPLLVSMIGGFYVTNYTAHRDSFEHILHDISPLVYVAFFTLTGVALKLDILIETGFIAAILFFVRMFSIFLGSYVGGTLAGEPALFRHNAWLGLITQAGIALGLAREVAVAFPQLGDAFATLIISVVVLNEIFGPLLLKYALRRVNETHAPDEDGVKRAVIIGIEPQSVALARQLQMNKWDVVLADIDQYRVDRLPSSDLNLKHITGVSEECLHVLLDEQTDAILAMLEDDDLNLQAIKIAQKDFNIDRLIVRTNNQDNNDKFRAAGAMIVNPALAMVNLFDQYVRAPQTGALFMHADPSFDILQVIVNNRDIDGLFVRDLRLPTDVLILEIARKEQTIVPNGNTKVRVRDNMTLVGPPSSLQEVSMRLGF